MIKKFQTKLNKKGEIYLRIKVRPNSSNTKIINIMKDETVKIDIAVKPEKGKANKELIKYLAKIFETGQNNVKIISGQRDKIKLIKIIKNYL